MKRVISSLFAVTFFLIVCSNSWAGITYNGSSTIGMGILQIGAVDAFKKKTGINFDLLKNDGSGKGMKALFEGKISLGGASRPLKQEEKDQGLLETVIGYDAIVIFVHASNPVKNISMEQLKGIFTGKIRNWKEVGGKNEPIEPNTEIQGEKRATMEMFQEIVLHGESYGRGFKEVDLPRDQIILVGKNKRSIATVSRGLLGAIDPIERSKVKILLVNNTKAASSFVRSGKYPITRPLNLVTKGAPTGQVKMFIDFMLSPQGQRIVSNNFVSAQ